MEKRIILAPISANKWQEPCLNLAAILDIFFLCNIQFGRALVKCGLFSWAQFLICTL